MFNEKGIYKMSSIVRGSLNKFPDFFSCGHFY